MLTLSKPVAPLASTALRPKKVKLMHEEKTPGAHRRMNQHYGQKNKVIPGLFYFALNDHVQVV
jgi:hypothetical protein